MKFHQIIAGCLAASALGGLQAQALTNGGQPVASARSLVSAAAVANPFKKECAAVTKAKLAAAYNVDIDCAFGGAIGPSRNLQDFTHPKEGVFCFLPSKAAGLSNPEKLAASYPSVQIEWYYSSGYSLLAYVLRTPFDCPAGYIEVRTYDFSGGPSVLTDNAAFYLKVE